MKKTLRWCISLNGRFRGRSLFEIFWYQFYIKKKFDCLNLCSSDEEKLRWCSNLNGRFRGRSQNIWYVFYINFISKDINLIDSSFVIVMKEKLRWHFGPKSKFRGRGEALRQKKRRIKRWQNWEDPDLHARILFSIKAARMLSSSIKACLLSLPPSPPSGNIIAIIKVAPPKLRTCYGCNLEAILKQQQSKITYKAKWVLFKLVWSYVKVLALPYPLR